MSDLTSAVPPGLERFLRAAAVRAAIGLALAVVMLGVVRIGAVRRLEDRLLDRRIVMWRQLAEANTSRITLVAIDQDSLTELHSQWPLPRGIYARAIDRLRKSGADAIGVSVVFDGKATDALQDQALSNAASGFDDIVLASRLDLAHDPPVVVAPVFKCSTGFCDVPLDTDGVARQFYLSPAGIDPPPVCMALEILRHLYHNMQFVPRGFVSDPGTLYPIAWAGQPDKTFHTVPLKRILAGGDISKDVKGCIVLIGSTLPGAANNIRTPFARGPLNVPPNPAMSTVELTANLLFTLLGADTLEPLSRAEYVTLMVGLVFFCFMVFVSLHPLLSMVCTVFVATLYGLLVTYEMILSQRILPLASPLLALVVTWAAAAVWRIVARHLRRRAAR